MGRKLLRPMRADAAGKPLLGEGARYLGVRMPPNRHADVVPDQNGMVHMGDHGVSVTPVRVEDLPEFLTPAESKNEKVFELDEDHLPSGLSFRPDPDDATHGFLAPATSMTAAAYRELVNSTLDAWRRL